MNPYEPSQTPIPLATEAEAQPWQDIFWEWERRRIFYNIVLVMIVIFGLTMTGIGPFYADTMVQCVVGGFFANCCYCAGPILEMHATWRKHQRVGWGMLLFVVGLVFSILVTLIALQIREQLFILPRAFVN